MSIIKSLILMILKYYINDIIHAHLNKAINVYIFWVTVYYKPYFTGKDTSNPPKWLSREVSTYKPMTVSIWTITYEHFLCINFGQVMFVYSFG